MTPEEMIEASREAQRQHGLNDCAVTLFLAGRQPKSAYPVCITLTTTRNSPRGRILVTSADGTYAEFRAARVISYFDGRSRRDPVKQSKLNYVGFHFSSKFLQRLKTTARRGGTTEERVIEKAVLEYLHTHPLENKNDRKEEVRSKKIVGKKIDSTTKAGCG